MTAPPGFHSAVLLGLLEQLQAWDVGRYVATGVYAPGDVPLVVTLLPDRPDAGVALTLYDKGDALELDDTLTGLQVRCRGRPSARGSAMDLADLVFDRLHGATDLDLHGVHLVQAIHISGGSLGFDAGNRPEYTSSYDLYLNRPSANRPD
ncbi:minor capsid protein [Luteipulveratus sp. YIM 133132]|uniref:minor capsid protein n=1 Tax=Luteipulveratus flavus TaxID=3031728 RepID=UPI0023AFE4A7|nr:minor capsid protein [Luteipulveratus sp. YIM 133132]MDE9364585.1 minor capsid protein [Luteipulveratus sp. YIM 133132]